MEDNSKVEYYKCDYCGCEFKVPTNKRVTTFVLHKDNYWHCPECGKYVFSKTSHEGFSGSGGGKF